MLIMSWLRVLASVVFFSVGFSERISREECSLSYDLTQEIKSYQDFVDKIISTTTNGPYSGVFFKNLTDFIVKFGARKTGTEVLDESVTYLRNELSKSGLKTKVEKVMVPVWLRGTESASYITKGQKKNLRIKGLGNTPSGDVTAPLLVVKDFEELEERKKEVEDKIVLFNAEFENYESTSIYRVEGPARASKLGAVGALVRSITPFSIGSIHVGSTEFKGRTKKIPAAAISLEDADILDNLFRKGERVVVKLKIRNACMDSKGSPEKNLIADIPGSLEEKKYVTVSGHIDSWDVGQGALDDGGGALLALHSLLLLKFLEIEPPKRTLRAILWTGEEMGYYGIKSYISRHKNELLNWTAAFESDAGLFEPLGFTVKANSKASCIIKEIASLYSGLGATEVERTNENVFSDIKLLDEHNVPLMEPLMKPNNYFWFHHTEGDSLRVMNSTFMDQHLAILTGTAYILANLSEPLPRD